MRSLNPCSKFSQITNFNFSAKIEVVKCPKDPREWHQVFEIYPVGINEKVLVELDMMCQCDCETPGHRVSPSICFLEIQRFLKIKIYFRNTLKTLPNVLDMVPTCVASASAPKTTLDESVNATLKI